MSGEAAPGGPSPAAPDFGPVTDAINTGSGKVVDAVGDVGRQVGEFDTHVQDGFADLGDKLGTGFDGVTDAVDKVGGAVGDVGQSVDNLGDRVDTGFGNLGRQLGDQHTEFMKAIGSFALGPGAGLPGSARRGGGILPWMGLPYGTINDAIKGGTGHTRGGHAIPGPSNGIGNVDLEHAYYIRPDDRQVYYSGGMRKIAKDPRQASNMQVAAYWGDLSRNRLGFFRHGIFAANRSRDTRARVVGERAGAGIPVRTRSPFWSHTEADRREHDRAATTAYAAPRGARAQVIMGKAVQDELDRIDSMTLPGRWLSWGRQRIGVQVAGRAALHYNQFMRNRFTGSIMRREDQRARFLPGTLQGTGVHVNIRNWRFARAHHNIERMRFRQDNTGHAINYHKANLSVSAEVLRQRRNNTRTVRTARAVGRGVRLLFP